MTCPKCHGELEQKGLMHSGNSKFKVFRCPKCGEEKMECIGLA